MSTCWCAEAKNLRVAKIDSDQTERNNTIIALYLITPHSRGKMDMSTGGDLAGWGYSVSLRSLLMLFAPFWT